MSSLSNVPQAVNAYVQVVDGEGEFCSDDNELNEIIAVAQQKTTNDGKAANDAPYSIISIMGCQSTGKSTLLNLLFGTSFRTMDASSGRSQTTKGIWLDSGRLQQNLVIMDLEGTDSGERGEDRTTFERQTALFALALAEVLIINMWEHDIGRYTASNYGILKTIFEVHLQLFSPQHKTILLFIIRDHIEEETPYEALKVKLFEEVTRIWSELRKPQDFIDKSVSDLFELRYSVLPHMKLQRQLFTEKAGELRKQFVDERNQNYLFASAATSSSVVRGSKSVPRDGFGHFAHSVWTTIKDNKELNLPTQREMLATFRCDEIIGQSVVEFVKQIGNEKETWSKALNADFGQVGQSLVDSILSSYDVFTQHYHIEIVERKRGELIQRLSDELYPLFTQQCRFVVSDCVSIFTSHLRAQLLNDEEMDDEFYKYVSEGKHKAETHFNKQLAMLIVKHLSWKTASVEDELTSKLDLALTKEKNKQLAKLEALTERFIKDQLTPQLSSILKRANSHMWSEIAQLHLTVTQTVNEFVHDKCNAYRCSSDELNHYKGAVDEQSTSLIRLLIDQFAAMILLHMRNRFDRQFRYDSDGIARRWKSAEEIRKVYNAAKADALSLLNLFAVFRLQQAVERIKRNENDNTSPTSPSHDDIDTLTFDQSSCTPDLIVITNLQQLEKESQFRIDVEGALREVEMEYERKIEARKLPTWGLALIAFLGWNEFLSVLRNPLLLILIVLIGSVLYILYSLNLLHPALLVARNIYQQCLTQVLKAIHQLQQKHGIAVQDKTNKRNSNSTASAGATAQHAMSASFNRVSSLPATEMRSRPKTSPLSPTVQSERFMRHVSPSASTTSPTSPTSTVSVDPNSPQRDSTSVNASPSNHHRSVGSRGSLGVGLKQRKGSDLKRYMTISRTTSKEIQQEIKRQLQQQEQAEQADRRAK